MEELRFTERLTSLRKVPSRKANLFKNIIPIAVIVIIVAAGILTGIIISSRNKNAIIAKKAALVEEDLPEAQKQSFSKTFRDDAEGVIEKNDLDKYAQGTHKLIRPGGEDQTAFLTSSVLDLDQYIGKKVKVFGETFSSSQVGWLMDVGKVEIVE